MGRRSVRTCCHIRLAAFGLVVKYPYASSEETDKAHLCRMRKWLRTAAMPDGTRPRPVLLQIMRGHFASPPISGALRPVRLSFRANGFRTGSGRQGEPVLFPRVLHGVESNEPQGFDVPQDRSGARSSAYGGGVVGPLAAPRRGRASHRLGQAQRRSLEPRCVSVPSRARPLSCREDVG